MRFARQCQRHALLALLVFFSTACTARAFDFGSPDGIGACTAQEREIVTAAKAVGLAHATDVQRLLTQNPGQLKPYARRYFGPSFEDRKSFVTAAFDELVEQFNQSSKLRVYCRNSEPNPVAVTCQEVARAVWLEKDGDRKEPALLLCNAFFDASGTTTDTLWGTLLHELTHGFGFKDYAVQYNDVFVLSREDDGLSVQNAESYRRFVEELVSAGVIP